MTDEERRLLAELFREDDRLRAEHADWLARREAASGAPVQKSDEPNILYRVTDNNSLQPAPERDAEPSDADEEFGTEYPAFNELMKSICEFVVEWTRQKLAPRDERISKLEAKIETLTALLGQRSDAPEKGADIVDLPDWRKRTDVA